jgi:hypothetical protein
VIQNKFPTSGQLIYLMRLKNTNVILKQSLLKKNEPAKMLIKAWLSF